VALMMRRELVVIEAGGELPAIIEGSGSKAASASSLRTSSTIFDPSSAECCAG
jgi:hypothetical protein